MRKLKTIKIEDLELIPCMSWLTEKTEIDFENSLIIHKHMSLSET